MRQPGVDEFNAEIREILLIPSNPTCTVESTDRRNLRGEAAEWCTSSISTINNLGQHCRRPNLNGRAVVGEPSENVARSCSQDCRPLGVGQPLDSIKNLSHRDGGNSQRAAILRREPLSQARRRFKLREFQDDVGLGDDLHEKPMKRGCVDRDY